MFELGRVYKLKKVADSGIPYDNISPDRMFVVHDTNGNVGKFTNPAYSKVCWAFEFSWVDESCLPEAKPKPAKRTIRLIRG